VCLCLQVVSVPREKFVCDVSHNCPENCTCIKRPSDSSFNVSCQPGTQDHLPEVLPDDPPPRIGWFHLNFSTSNIQTLEFRPYLMNTTWIDVSKSNLQSIPENTWRTLTKMDHVDLSGNQLTVLPKLLESDSENITFRWLALYDNPLRCNCEDKWIRGWLQSLGQALFVPRYQPLAPAVCGSPDRLWNKNILHVTDEDFCRNYIIEVRVILCRFFVTMRYINSHLPYHTSC